MIVVDEDQQLLWGWQTTVVAGGRIQTNLMCLDWNSSFLEAQMASQMNLGVQRSFSMSNEVSMNPDPYKKK